MKKLIFALLAGATAMGAAHAEGGYVGLGVASADHDFKVGGATSVNSDGYKASAKIFGGYEFTPMWGVEAGYTDLRNANADFTLNGVNSSVQSKGSRTYVAAKATVPVNDQFSVYGKLGVGYSKVELSSATPGLNWSDNKTEAYGAIGGQLNINKQVALTLEYERYGKKKDFGAKADAITVGARYSF